MSQYHDLSPDDVAAIVRREIRRSNPTFVVGPLQRNLSWAFFSVRMFLDGKITFGELGTILAGGKKDGPVKRKVKEESEKEVIASFGGRAPRFVVGRAALVPHNTSLAGLIDFLTLIQQIFVEDQYHAHEFIKKDSIVIDAGANIGMFTALAASIANEGMVYAFEPAAGTSNVLAGNMRDAKNVSVIAAGLGEQDVLKEMRVNADFPGFSALADTGIEATGDGMGTVVSEMVQIRTIDSFVKERGLPRVDFIKMDTEGYEKNIIQGARETIKKFRPVIAASAYHFPGDKEEMPRMVLEIEPGYRYVLSKRAEEDLVFWFPQ